MREQKPSFLPEMCLSQQCSCWNSGIIQLKGFVRGQFHDRHFNECLSWNWPQIGLIADVKSALVGVNAFVPHQPLPEPMVAQFLCHYMTLLCHNELTSVLIGMLSITSSLLCSSRLCHVFCKWWLLCVCIIFCFSLSCVCLSQPHCTVVSMYLYCTWSNKVFICAFDITPMSVVW